MTEGPIRTIMCLDTVVKGFMKYPCSRLCFFTVKDNTHSTKWDKIGKVNDWIRRYSDCYIVVKGTNGGTHFHGLAGIKPNHTPRYQKGIHMHLQYVNQKKEEIPPDFLELAKSADMRTYIISNNFEEQSRNLFPEQQDILRAICKGINKYWSAKRTREKTTVRKTKKENSILRIINYLDVNLQEPRDNDISKYTDYVSRI